MELAVGFTLTIMLVMYTLYQSISESLTKTAYLKMIDYWLLFCLLLPLTIFVLEIFMILQKAQKKSAIHPGQVSAAYKQKFCLTTKLIRLLVPAVSVIFVLGYFIAAWIVMKSFDGNSNFASNQ